MKPRRRFGAKKLLRNILFTSLLFLLTSLHATEAELLHLEVGSPVFPFIECGVKTELRAVLDPPLAALVSSYSWYINEVQEGHTFRGFYFITFQDVGTRHLRVIADSTSGIGRANSDSVNVTVVERIHVGEGLVHNSSVYALSSFFKVDLKRGSHLMFLWNFGDGSPSQTTSGPIATHSYSRPGTYRIEVTLKNPLGELRLNSTVQVSAKGICDEPRIRAFYPPDPKLFYDVQEVVLEPDVWRRCEISKGPQFFWQVKGSDGSVVKNSNWPTLILQPLNVGAVLETEKGTLVEFLVSLVKERRRPLAPGNYLVQLTVKEDLDFFLNVKTTATTSFTVLRPPLSVVFVGGSQRLVNADANVTLRVSVYAPALNYTLQWGCTLLNSPHTSCLALLDRLPTLRAPEKSFLQKLEDLWTMMWGSTPWAKQDDSLERALYLESLVVPPDKFPEGQLGFLFTARVTYGGEVVTVSQEILLRRRKPTHNVLITMPVGAHMPLGGLDQMVFEAQCDGCQALQCHWTLRERTRQQGGHSPQASSRLFSSGLEASMEKKVLFPSGKPHMAADLKKSSESSYEESSVPSYVDRTKEFVRRTGAFPDFACRSHNWGMCAPISPLSTAMSTYLKKLNLAPRREKVIKRFVSMTSTGVDQPLLVLETSELNLQQEYVLEVSSTDSLGQTFGYAKMELKFSPQPTLADCRVSEAEVYQTKFVGSCRHFSGTYYPVRLRWSYHHTLWGLKTIFYFGTRPEIKFSLPPGNEDSSFAVYVSVEAVDGAGVKFSWPVPMMVTVEPRFTDFGVMSIFNEISMIEADHPSLVLQEVRSLAWELNQMPSSIITQTILDNILTIFFYRHTCNDTLVTRVTSRSPLQWKPSPLARETKYGIQELWDLFIKVNLLMSCARDHLSKIVYLCPYRDEMEVLQVLSAAVLVLDSPEYISWATFDHVVNLFHDLTKRHMILWDIHSDVRNMVSKQFFMLGGVVMVKQREIYDQEIVHPKVTNSIIWSLIIVLEKEVMTHFLQETSLIYSTSTMDYEGRIANRQMMTSCEKTCVVTFCDNYLVSSEAWVISVLRHFYSPYMVEDGGTTVDSYVINLHIHWDPSVPRCVLVSLPRSKVATDMDYDFRRPGLLRPDSLNVYYFIVEEHSPALSVTLQFTSVIGNDPVSAVLLICNDLQSLWTPIHKMTLGPTDVPTSDSMLVLPGTLPTGELLLVVMDENSYNNHWARETTYLTGAEFLIAAWWSECLLFYDAEWHSDECQVELSDWDTTNCRCSSVHATYGARNSPILTEEATVNINELMLIRSYWPFYTNLLVMLLYVVLAVLIYLSDCHGPQRQDIWLPDNDTAHKWAYYLTIKTGNQRNAGTRSKVYAVLHGTKDYSETRELQCDKVIFTRGSNCSFIITSSICLGDICQVHLWHDNSEEDEWFVSEVTVADLVSGAQYAYPCYQWLSVLSEDMAVNVEITLETPLTFWQEFHKLLPQMVNRFVIFYSLFLTPNNFKFGRLQRLIMSLMMYLTCELASEFIILKINKFHTMITPDFHMESFGYGWLIALMLLPLQYILELTFWISSNLKENSYNKDERNQSPVPHSLYDSNHLHWLLLQEWANSFSIESENKDSKKIERKISLLSLFREALKDVYFFLLRKIRFSRCNFSSLKQLLCCHLGWIISFILLSGWLLITSLKGVSMPKDYSALWYQIVFITICFSVLIMQPVAAVIYTAFYISYRKCPTSYFSNLTSVNVMWSKLKLLLPQLNSPRSSLLLFAWPPRKAVLHRSRERRRRKMFASKLVKEVFCHVFLISILVILVANMDLGTRYQVQKSLLESIKNGSCRHTEDENFFSFHEIMTIDDWWKWGFSEFLDLTYNKDSLYTSSLLFCDTNALIIGTPRIRNYDVGPSACEAEESEVGTDLLGNDSCYLNYHNQNSLFSFSFEKDREYHWDAHFLSELRGKFSSYGYTSSKQHLPTTRRGAAMLLSSLKLTTYAVSSNKTIRAVVTEYTLYHPVSKLYTTVNLLAEFPSLSGSEIYIKSSTVTRYTDFMGYISIFADAVLLVVMLYFTQLICIYFYYKRAMKNFWTFLDVLFFIFGWIYLISLFLRPHIAEDIWWELKVTYFQKYVNLKSLMTWDATLCTLTGAVLFIELMRATHLLRFVSRINFLSSILKKALKEVLAISAFFILLIACCYFLGWLWFCSVLYPFHTWLQTITTIFQTISLRTSFFTEIKENTSGWLTMYGYFYFAVIFFLLFLITRALYAAVFIYSYKNHEHQRPLVQLTWRDLKDYFEERLSKITSWINKKENKKKDALLTENFEPFKIRVALLFEKLHLIDSKLDCFSGFANKTPSKSTHSLLTEEHLSEKKEHKINYEAFRDVSDVELDESLLVRISNNERLSLFLQDSESKYIAGQFGNYGKIRGSAYVEGHASDAYDHKPIKCSIPVRKERANDDDIDTLTLSDE